MVVATTAIIGVFVSVKGTLAGAGGVLPASVLSGSGGGGHACLLARALGFVEIRDTMWATLDLQAAS